MKQPKASVQEANEAAQLLDSLVTRRSGRIRPCYATKSGLLFRGDSLKILPMLRDESVDMVFADPPFNIGKNYGRKVNDRKDDDSYLRWRQTWIDECIRVLKDGGSLFLYHIPRWNIRLANILLDRGMTFRDWIVVDVKLVLPIFGRLYPSH